MTGTAPATSRGHRASPHPPSRRADTNLRPTSKPSKTCPRLPPGVNSEPEGCPLTRTPALSGGRFRVPMRRTRLQVLLHPLLRVGSGATTGSPPRVAIDGCNLNRGREGLQIEGPYPVPEWCRTPQDQKRPRRSGGVSWMFYTTVEHGNQHFVGSNPTPSAVKTVLCRRRHAKEATPVVHTFREAGVCPLKARTTHIFTTGLGRCVDWSSCDASVTPAAMVAT